MSIQFEYFYGSQAEQFSFYRIPKVLFTDETLAGISVEAKQLETIAFSLFLWHNIPLIAIIFLDMLQLQNCIHRINLLNCSIPIL